MVRADGVVGVVDWFERHLKSFYTLGWFYVHEQRQLEELFYRAIMKVHKGMPRYKREVSYETWVTSIFLDSCREISAEREAQAAAGELEPRQGLFAAMEQLEDNEKAAILLTYVNGFSKEETAHILHLSVDEVKGLLFSGIQAVRKHLDGSTYNGCKEFHKNYIDYLEKSMDRPEKIEFEVHLYHCQECQEDLAAFQDVTLMLNDAEWLADRPVPADFMANVKKKLTEREEFFSKRQKKRKKSAIIFASVFAFIIGTGFFTGAFSHAYYSWTEEDDHLRAFLQEGIGQRVDLEAENEGVKIRIKGVVADDVQTLVFYEIEDTKEDKQYFMNYEEGLLVKNADEVMSQDPNAYPRFFPPDLEAEMNEKEKNVFYGKVALPPLAKETGVINLNITRLQELGKKDSELPGRYGFVIDGYKAGEWKFEVPVTKQPSKDYALDDQTEIEGVPIRFDKLTVAPTATILQYSINIQKPEKRLDFVRFANLIVNEQKIEADWFGSGYSNFQGGGNWSTFQTQFDPIYGEKPEKVKLQFASAYLTFEENKSVELDVNMPLPQTFEYAGSTISIDKIEVGQPTTIVLSDHEIENREYESMHINIVGENENGQEHEPISMQLETEGVFVDKNGVVYDPMSSTYDFEKIEQPRHFVTVQTYKLEGNNVIPKRLDIYSYNSVKYLDEVVEISVK